MAKDYAKPFYNSAAWKKAQKLYLTSRFYICESCGGAASLVHHKKHITPENIHNPIITLNADNFKALCLECHNAEHASGGASVAGISFDKSGNIVRMPPV